MGDRYETMTIAEFRKAANGKAVYVEALLGDADPMMVQVVKSDLFDAFRFEKAKSVTVMVKAGFLLITEVK